MASEPIVVLYKSNVCQHCQNLTKIWDNVMTSLKSVYPKLRFYVVTAKDNTGKFDENTIPKDLLRYAKWYPMILLVPGKVWDAAMASLGPRNPVQIKDGVQIMNARWDDKDNLVYDQKYDIRKAESFANWLKDALANEDFKRVSAGGRTSKVLVPTTNTPSQPIAPLMSGITKPDNSASNYASSGSDRRSAMEPGGDVCSMRIISRPGR